MDENDTDRELKNIALDIKKKFIDNKFKSQPGFQVAMYEDDSKWWKYFVAAARLCRKLSADPEVYVNSQFRKGCDGSKIHPQFLTSDVAQKNYLGICATDLPPLEDYNVQILYLRQQIEKAKRKVENILMDDNIDFSAWFRICITVEPMQEVINKYKEKAKQELTLDLVKFLKSKNLDYTRITNE